jgi:hypothetical protein
MAAEWQPDTHARVGVASGKGRGDYTGFTSANQKVARSHRIGLRPIAQSSWSFQPAPIQNGAIPPRVLIEGRLLQNSMTLRSL